MTSVTFYKINEYSWKECHACDFSKSKVWAVVKEIFANIGRNIDFILQLEGYGSINFCSGGRR
jgi:hypothetical protein